MKIEEIAALKKRIFDLEHELYMIVALEKSNKIQQYIEKVDNCSKLALLLSGIVMDNEISSEVDKACKERMLNLCGTEDICEAKRFVAKIEAAYIADIKLFQANRKYDELKAELEREETVWEASRGFISERLKYGYAIKKNELIYPSSSIFRNREEELAFYKLVSQTSYKNDITIYECRDRINRLSAKEIIKRLNSAYETIIEPNIISFFPLCSYFLDSEEEEKYYDIMAYGKIHYRWRNIVKDRQEAIQQRKNYIITHSKRIDLKDVLEKSKEVLYQLSRNYFD